MAKTRARYANAGRSGVAQQTEAIRAYVLAAHRLAGLG